MNDKSIWQERQNRPTLIVRDLAPYASPEVVYESLLRRGVFKWLSVRQKLIRLKNEWKDDIRKLNRKKSEQEKGYLKAMERCRKQLRELCHSKRWQVPDNDKDAIKYLKSRTY